MPIMSRVGHSYGGMAEWTKATVLKAVVLRTPVNEWLNPMKEASSNEGAFLVSATPPSGSIGGGYGKTRGMCSRRMTC